MFIRRIADVARLDPLRERQDYLDAIDDAERELRSNALQRQRHRNLCSHEALQEMRWLSVPLRPEVRFDYSRGR